MNKEHSSPDTERFLDRLSTRVDRRTFTKGLLAAAVALPTLQKHPIEIRENPPIVENHPDISRHMVMIDFAPDTPNPEFVQWIYYPDDELLSHELGEKYLGPKTRVAVGALYTGMNWLSEKSDMANAILDSAGLDGDMEKLFLRNNPHFAIASTALDSVGGHGEGVHHVMWQTIQGIEKDGKGLTPRIYPIQKTMSIDFTEDLLGNFTLRARADSQKISHALDYYPLQDIVNFSWQAGDVEVKVSTKEYTEDCIIRDLDPRITEKFGAYRKEAAVANLRELFSICNEHQDKLFFAALGNLGDDIREARELLADEWPENALLVGQWKREQENDYGKPHYDSFGADIYVENKMGEITFADGSSHSTAMLSAVAAYLREQGYELSEIKQLLIEDFSLPRSYVSEPEGLPPYALTVNNTCEFDLTKLLSVFGPRNV